MHPVKPTRGCIPSSANRLSLADHRPRAEKPPARLPREAELVETHTLTEQQPGLHLLVNKSSSGKPVSPWHNASNIRISSAPDEMTEGLFGQTFFWVFEILPYLHANGIFPDWKICTAHYGAAPDGLTIPGVLDLAYQVSQQPRKEIRLVELRAHQRHVLGNDWHRLSNIWHAYFRIPGRIADRASTFGSLADTVGIHYRGNDKQTAVWDTNPVSHRDYLSIITDFLVNRPDFRRIFLATDDANFCQFLKDHIAIEIVNLGSVGFHKAEGEREEIEIKTDRAMLDCVLLSRCGAVLLTSSALPSFTKILNPDLEIYRVAASKFFASIPYFPVAYIPIYQSSSSAISTLVDELTDGDWTKAADANPYSTPFASRPHWSPLVRLAYIFIRKLPGFRWARRTAARQKWRRLSQIAPRNNEGS
jgi:hypothetical protein